MRIFKCFLVILILSIESCALLVPKSARIDPKFCYDESNTEIESLINIDGYFFEKNVYIKKAPLYSDSEQFKTDTSVSYHKIVFFHDGIVNFDGRWGGYLIKDNIIKVQYRDHPSAMAALKTEIWYEIIDRNTIKKHYRVPDPYKERNEVTEEEIQKYQAQNNKQILPIKFVPSNKDFIDHKHNWLLKRSWFWCDKQEYRAWKKANRD